MKFVNVKGHRLKTLELHETLQFWRGREFERQMSKELIEHGFHVVRCYDLHPDGRCDKAPLLSGPFQGLRLPDTLALKGGNQSWREFKNKGHPTYTYSHGSYDEGIGRRCYDDYLKVEQISGIPVYLMIGEYDPGIVLIQSLAKLGKPRIYSGDKMDPGGMVFWPCEAFDIWGDYDKAQTTMFARAEYEIHRAPRKWKL